MRIKRLIYFLIFSVIQNVFLNSNAWAKSPDYWYTNPIQIATNISITESEQKITIGDVLFSYSHCNEYKHCIVSSILIFAAKSSCVKGDKWKLEDTEFEVVSVQKLTIGNVIYEPYCVIDAHGKNDEKTFTRFGFSPQYGLVGIGAKGAGVMLVNKIPVLWTKKPEQHGKAHEQ